MTTDRPQPCSQLPECPAAYIMQRKHSPQEPFFLLRRTGGAHASYYVINDTRVDSAVDQVTGNARGCALEEAMDWASQTPTTTLQELQCFGVDFSIVVQLFGQ